MSKNNHIELKESGVIDYMTPDQVDKFIDWIRSRVDWRSFIQSTQEYKKRQVKIFFRDNPEIAQLKLFA